MHKCVTILGLFGALICSTAFADSIQQCDSKCQIEIAEIQSQAVAIGSLNGQVRGDVIETVEAVGITSPYIAVKVKALDLMDSPIKSFVGSIRGTAIDATLQIALSTQDVSVEKRALALLESPSKSVVGDIRGSAIDAIGAIGVHSEAPDVKQFALALLTNPQSSLVDSIANEANGQARMIIQSLK